MYDDDDDEISLPPLGPAFNEQYIYDDPEANQYALPLVNKPTGNNDIIGNNNYAVLYYSRACHIHKYIGIYIYTIQQELFLTKLNIFIPSGSNVIRASHYIWWSTGE